MLRLSIGSSSNFSADEKIKIHGGLSHLAFVKFYFYGILVIYLVEFYLCILSTVSFVLAAAATVTEKKAFKLANLKNKLPEG